ncbi:uncharacterized protein LOC135842629 [Planococcus citri]|uniref:uncharacterized protein LOC135842629 n=1 Tax=Planococcus citri TaxID=170843 RepID=UPI0031F7E6D3
MSDNQKQNPSNDPLIFYYHAGKLVDLAAVSLLAALKHHKITQMHLGNEEIRIASNEMHLISVNLPKSITNMLRELADRMDESIAKWWKYHWEAVFFCKIPSDDMITLFDQFVWLPDGSISFEKTARKLLDSDKLTNKQKLQIACTYFFIEDANRLKGTLSPDEIHFLTKSFCTDFDPFLEYWYCKIRHMTGFHHLTNTDIDLFTELTQPFCRKYYHHWPVVEYFWNQLRDEEERRRKVEQILDAERDLFNYDDKRVELIWHFLPKLTSSQLDSLLKNYGYEVIYYLIDDPNYVEYAISTWKRLVNLIDNRNLNFLLDHVTDLEENQDYTDGILREMWLYMSEQQKKFVANQQELHYVTTWIKYCLYNSPNHQLIVDIFSYWDSERRRQCWMANWTSLVIGQMGNKNKIEEIMKMVFDSNENIAVFKCTTMIDYNSIRTACENLLKQGHFEGLQNYLNYCTEDQNVIRNLKKQIILTMPKDDLFHALCNCSDDESLDAEFEHFLSDIFTTDEIKYFQRDVLMASWQKMEEMLCKGSVHKPIQCVAKYLSSEEDLCSIKAHFIKYSRNHDDIARRVKMADWVDLLSWCLGGNNSLTERLKISLQRTEAQDVEMEELPIYRSFCNRFLRDE